MIVITSSIDWEKWDNFVYNHPNGNIFQTSYMARVYSSTKNYEPISLAAVDMENNNILAVLQAVIIRQISGIVSSFSARSIVFGGPLFIESKQGLEAVKELINYYEKLVANRIVYTEFRNMWDTSQIKDIFIQNGYQFVNYFNALVNLNKPTDELWNQLKRDKKRGITKSEEFGITVDISEKKSDMVIFYELVKETYNVAKIPLAHISLFESVFEVLTPEKKSLLLFARDKDGEIIATQLALIYKDTIYAWYTGSHRESLKFHPGDSLIWYLLKYGSEHQYKVFDFGGGGGPNKNENLREYKSRFGTEFLCYGRYEKNYSAIKSKIANTGLKIYKRLL